MERAEDYVKMTLFGRLMKNALRKWIGGYDLMIFIELS